MRRVSGYTVGRRGARQGVKGRYRIFLFAETAVMVVVVAVGGGGGWITVTRRLSAGKTLSRNNFQKYSFAKNEKRSTATTMTMVHRARGTRPRQHRINIIY